MLTVLEKINLRSLVDGKNYQYNVGEVIEDAEVFKKHLSEANYDFYLKHNICKPFQIVIQDTTQDDIPNVIMNTVEPDEDTTQDTNNLVETKNMTYKFTQNFEIFDEGTIITSKDLHHKTIASLLKKGILMELKVL